MLAVASDWRPSAVAILRLSGPDAYALLAAGLGLEIARPVDRRARVVSGRLRCGAWPAVPVTAYCFAGPRSYTGQDLVELHVPGALPLVHRVADGLLAAGARRAQPGEFTARAFLAGKLAPDAVAGVQALVAARSAEQAREAARTLTAGARADVASWRERILDLLARVEAGIDFVEEEDIRFIEADELVGALDGLMAELPPRATVGPSGARPHVALVGLPNAGKSTLFNALLGEGRAIVSPVLGTTRDVLSAEVTWAGVPLVLQDCAGLGATADELAAAAHRLAEATAEQADIVLWVHAQDAGPSVVETAALARLDSARVIFVLSKADRPAVVGLDEVAVRSAQPIAVCALTGRGLEPLRQAVLAAVERRGGGAAGIADGRLVRAREALERARKLAAADREGLRADEVALDMRQAAGWLSTEIDPGMIDRVLGRIFATFCVGK